MSQCRSCDAEILWCKTLKGKSIPVDPDPVKGGNLELVLQSATKPPRVVIHTSDPNITRHISHFATCPNAKEHRK